MEPAVTETRAVSLRTLAITWIGNTFVAAVIGTAYFGDALQGAPAFVRLFAGAALVSSLATLFFLAALPLCVLALIGVRERALAIVQACVWTLALFLVFVDTKVYALFRYHLNGMVWNLLTTPGGQDTFELGPGTWIGAAVLAVVVFWIQRRAWKVAAKAAVSRIGWVRAAVAFVLALVVFEKLTYSFADARHDRSITSRAALFPAYQRLTLKRTLARFVEIDSHPEARVDVAGAGLLLRYPHEMPVVPAGGARPNVLVIVIDSLRADMLTPSAMPKLTEWSRGARVFANHASGGNATRFGIFALIYGIHGTYWMPVKEESAPPVLVTALGRAGYDRRVISAAKMSYPEFRSTAWVDINDSVEDAFREPEKFDRDLAVVARFDEWLEERIAQANTAPFFCFTLLDAPHQTYSWPPDRTIFEPSTRTLDYLDLAGRPDDASIATVKNSYANAVHFSDANAARMIDSLRTRGLLENTIVVVTGDHGEEFFENGFFGHTSNFTPEQVHVAFVMSGPGIPIGVETRPTCHVDFPPTILEALGVDAALRPAWSQGSNLLSPPERRDRVVAGWQEVALWVDGGILHIPLEGHRGLVEARDMRWRLLADESEFIGRHGTPIADLARACRRFLR